MEMIEAYDEYDVYDIYDRERQIFGFEIPVGAHADEAAEIEDKATVQYELLGSMSTEIGILKGEVGKIKSNLKSLQITVLSKITDLKVKIIALTTLQAEIKVLLEEMTEGKSNKSTNIDQNKFGDYSVKFPITSVEKLLEFENELQDCTIKNKMIHYFGCFGGLNQKATLRNIVKNLCTDNVYEKYTWKAASKGKEAFIMLREINNTIFGAMCRSYKDYTQHEYATFLQGHIKQAKFRLKARSTHNDEQKYSEVSNDAIN